MNQSQFEKRYGPRWHQFRSLLGALEKKTGGPEPDKLEIGFEEFPGRYRQLCNHYNLARARHYSPALVDELHDLVLRGYRQLYHRRTGGLVWSAIHFIAHDFPCTVRLHSRVFWVAFACFFLPAAGMGLATYHAPAMIYSLLSESRVVDMESMYDPTGKKLGRAPERDAETDFAMFGYYIFNNISIGFRTFAGGIVFGLGAVFFLLFNGLIIGGVGGYLSHPPYTEVFWQFVSGHAAFELIAIVISGAAGLLLGYRLLCPGRYRRSDSLRLVAPVALKLVMGAALMLVCAAFIEAFWSSAAMPAGVKFAVATVNWLVVACYLLFAGRSRS